jgi:hypothetical protein
MSFANAIPSPHTLPSRTEGSWTSLFFLAHTRLAQVGMCAGSEADTGLAGLCGVMSAPQVGVASELSLTRIGATRT